MTSLGSVVLATVLLSQIPPTELKEYGETIKGEWVLETSIDADFPPVAEKGDKLKINYTNEWVLNRNAISTKWIAMINGTTVGSGQGLIGWDKSAKRIVEHGFNTLGGSYSGVIQKRGDKWYRSGIGVGLSGEVIANMSIVSIVDDDTHKSLDTGRITPEGEALPNKEVTIRRRRKE